MMRAMLGWNQSAMTQFSLGRVSVKLDKHEIGTGTWRATRPLLLGSSALVIACIVPIFWKYERWRNDDLTGIASKSVAISTAIITIIGIMGLALGGIDDMFGQGSDLMGLFQVNAFLAIVLSICGAGAFGVLRNMKKVALGEKIALQTEPSD